MKELHIDTTGKIKWGHKDFFVSAEEGIEYYTQLLSSNPKNIEALFSRFYILYRQEEYYLAKEDFIKIIQHNSGQQKLGIFPINGSIVIKYISEIIEYTLMDIVNITINDSKEIKYWTKIIKADENDSIAYTYRGLFHYHKKEYDKAIEDSSKALALNVSNKAVNYFNRRRGYFAKGELTKTITDTIMAKKYDCSSDANVLYKSVAYGNTVVCDKDNRSTILNTYKKVIEKDIEDIAEEFGITPCDAINYYNRAMDDYYLRYSNWKVKK